MNIKNNKGFTFYEVLATIILLGIISSIALPNAYKYYKEYEQLQFEQKVMIFERRTIDCLDKFKIAQYGSAEYNSKVKFANEIVTYYDSENAYIDCTDPEFINYLVYEIIIGSQFKNINYRYEYSPAIIKKLGTKVPSKFTIFLEDNIIIEFNMLLYSGGTIQITSFNSVSVIKGDYNYSFVV